MKKCKVDSCKRKACMKGYCTTHGLEKEGFNAGGIWRCCKGIQKSYKNYKWEWVEDGE